MIVKKIGFGNFQESFVEDRLKEGVNIIFSDDNNKGKTLLFQALMFSIGNTPIFPENFKKEDYYFYSKIDFNGEEYKFLRKNDSFIVRKNDELFLFESVSGLKHFFKKQGLLDIPIIEKDGRDKLADLEIFYELFFIGQDNRNPSNIINKGYYNKNDFINMIMALKGYKVVNNKLDMLEIKNKIDEINDKIKENKKYLKLRKENKKISSYLDNFSDSEEFNDFRYMSRKYNERLGAYKRERNREENRKEKLKELLRELESLNIEMKTGNIYCVECGSDKISFKNHDFHFELSNAEVRNQILSSIEFQIAISEDEINELEIKINILQGKLKELLINTPVELKSILLYSEYFEQDIDYDKKIMDLKEELNILKKSKETIESEQNSSKEGIKLTKKELIERMNRYYKKIDSSGTLIFDNLFTKKDTTFSGSDKQVYYFCRLLALNDLLNHPYPIIIDSFREGEISTAKEEIMLAYFKKINKQVILSSTLKVQEYVVDKYNNIDHINLLDYSSHKDSKILSSNFSIQFNKILKEFNINIE